MTSIIIPTWNHLEDCLQPCITSILKYTDLTDKEIIVVANGCTDDTEDWLKRYDFIKVLSYPEALGYTKATNAGLLEAKGEYVILLNNDTRLLPQPVDTWISMLKTPLLRDKTVGMTGPLKLWANKLNRRFLVGFCMMTTKSLIKECGYLNEIYNPGGSEDIELTYKMEEKGYKVLQVPDDHINFSIMENRQYWTFPMEHQGEATVHNELKDTWEPHFWKNDEIVNKKFMKFGIVMPCYNAEKTLRTTLNSILKQSHDRFEVFVLDDNSTDKSWEILKEYRKKDKRMHIFKSDANMGPARARNTMLDIILNNASKYFISHIAYCDADDRWRKYHLAQLTEGLYKAEMCYTDCEWVDETGKKVQFYGAHKPETSSPTEFYKGNFVWISAMGHSIHCLAKPQRFEDKKPIWFDPECDSLEDWDFWAYLASLGFNLWHITEKSMTYLAKTNGMAAKSTDDIRARIQAKIEGYKQISPELAGNYATGIKLHLGSGDQKHPGYINIDLHHPNADKNLDARDLSEYPDNSVDEILALHLIEHFHFQDGQKALAEWYRVLRPGGVLRIETPDMLNLCKHFVAGPEDLRIKLYPHFFAYPWEEGQAHYFLYSETQLGWGLQQIGFKKITRKPGIRYQIEPELSDIYLYMEAIK